MFPFSEAVEKIVGGGVQRIGGLWGSSRAFLLSALSRRIDRSIFIMTPTDEAAEVLLTDLRLFSSWLTAPAPVFSFPCWEILPYDTIPPHPDIIHERMSAYRALEAGHRGIFVVPVHSVMQRVMSRDLLKRAVMEIKTGMEIERDSLISHLADNGFEPVDVVTARGAFNVRGGIVDLFSPGEDAPVRIEFFGDTIESIRTFDPETQRSIKGRGSSIIMPAAENPSSLSSLFDYLPSETIIVFDEIREIDQAASRYWRQIWEAYREVGTPPLQEENVDRRGWKTPPTGQRSGTRMSRLSPITEMSEPDKLYLSPEDVFTSCERFQLHFEMEPLPMEGAFNIPINTASDAFLETVRNAAPLMAIAEKLNDLRRSLIVIFVSPTQGQAERFRDILEEYNVPATIKGGDEMTPFLLEKERREALPVLITCGNVSSGFLYPYARLMIVAEEEIFGKKTNRRPLQKQKARPFVTSFQDIKPGDYVVHVYHGVGQYDGLRRKAFSGGEGDYLCIRYAAGDSIYVPVDNMDLVQKYIGTEGHAPNIDRLQGSRWEQTKKRVEKAIEEIAADLVDLYAAREVMEGFSYSPDNPMFREFEASFEYEETPDQLSAIEDVKKDMESRRPMDRLICGDVGYGKTEVALRASCKAVMDGKQVAVLVPTTLLAQQHYQTFSRRFASFPIRVEMLSRFRALQEQKEIIKALAEGTVDILIGTQRLLQQDVHFRDLGLIVVDEEQRFGVAQKERLKQLRKVTDVLTLSATPIPRTLQMALSGIRDLSVIETPPEDRLSIRTVISPFDTRLIRHAVLREFARDGRVFFVHNRVESIDSIAAFLKDLIPEARIAVAHGQMREHLLEKVMLRFINGDDNLLVCSSIIESGLDIPSANTIIINRADRFGLADLYQLRGRVGRSGHQAYAYLLVPGEETLTEDAKKRIKAIQELTDLGAGFRLAIKDLEIRGAGNLLGRRQSGHIAAVGFELYNQMLEKAVKRLQGEKTEEELNPILNLRVSAFIPEDYIEDPSQRLSFYKRLASVKEGGVLVSLGEEMVDRYGLFPQEVENLFRVIEIKLLARTSLVSKIECGGEGVFFTLDPQSLSGAKIKGDILKALISAYPGRIRFVSEFTFLLFLSFRDPLQLFSETINCLKVIRGCV